MSYGEPWEAIQLPPYRLEAGEDDSTEASSELRGDLRPVQLWAHLGIAGEAECFTSPGEIKDFDGRRPVLQAHRLKGLRGGAATHVLLAQRVAACVNFCAGHELGALPSLADLLDCWRSRQNQDRRAEVIAMYSKKKPTTKRRKPARAAGEGGEASVPAT
jgi:hypothetical protein